MDRKYRTGQEGSGRDDWCRKRSLEIEDAVLTETRIPPTLAVGNVKIWPLFL